jgi:hypothetical protein
MDLHAGIINYLIWAKKRYREDQTQDQFRSDLSNSFIPASQEFIQKNHGELEGRLVYGDSNAKLDDDIAKLIDDLKGKSGCKNVSDTFRGASSFHIDFGDENSLIFFVSSNKVHPSEIEVLNRMNKKYVEEIQNPKGDWRPKVYHNYKCEWEMMEIEGALKKVRESGLHLLTHSSFYWVMEEAEAVELFVSACTAGVIRIEPGATGQKFWICGPPGKTHLKNEDKVICLTDPDKTSDIFTALVQFAILGKPFKKIQPIDFKSIKKMRDEAILKQKGKDWEKIKEKFIKDDPFDIAISDYNREISENDPERYIKHRDLFLARIFRYYLVDKE